MGVPFIDIKRFENGFLDKWNLKIAEMTKNAQFIGGAEVSNLEKKLSEYNSVGYTVSCANGTDAIQLALRAVGIGRGSKVLLPDLTFWATFEAVVNVGADPYTVDVDKEDMQLSFIELKKAIDSVKPDAVVIVHLYGWGSKDLEEIRNYCTSKKIPLVEDGAQCFGAKYKNESIYKNCHIATTSFYPAKVLGAAGDGGAVFTNDSALAEKVRQLANHGRTAHYGHGLVGWNSRMDSFQALFVNMSLDLIEERLKSRREFAVRYQKDLKSLGLNVISPPKDFIENGYCNVVIMKSKEEKEKLQNVLKENGIAFGNIYPGTMSTQPGAKEYLKGNFSSYDISGSVCVTVINLPLFPYMTDSEYKEVIETVKKYLK